MLVSISCIYFFITNNSFFIYIFPSFFFNQITKNRGELKIEHFKTDEKGYVEFVVESGREYLMDSVIIYSKKGDPEKKEPIWHSIWASTTFLVPERTL